MMAVTACTEDAQRSNAPISVSVSCSPMRNGRALKSTVWDEVPAPEYPDEILVVPNVGEEYIIEKNGSNDNSGYIAYHFAENGPMDLEMEGKSFTAYSPKQWTEIPTISPCDYLSGEGHYDWNKAHLFIDLKHATALLRFRFAVDEQYDKSRQVVITNITLNGTDIAVRNNGNALLSTTMSCEAICYVNPTKLKKGDKLNISCTYDIYDKDEVGTGHLNRKDVKASNSMTLGAAGSSISEIKVAHYYDLNITINPTYMYVMSEHDNKHMTIE